MKADLWSRRDRLEAAPFAETREWQGDPERTRPLILEAAGAPIAGRAGVNQHAPGALRLAGTVELIAAMAPVTLPHVAEGLTRTAPDSPEFVERYADQLAKLVEHLGT